MYVYYSTKYIHFELYIRWIMHGCNVLDKFDKMSLLITRSRFYNHQTGDSDDDETIKFEPLSSDEQTYRKSQEYESENKDFGRTYCDSHLDYAHQMN